MQSPSPVNHTRGSRLSWAKSAVQTVQWVAEQWPPRAPPTQKALRSSVRNAPSGRNQPLEARAAAHSAGRLVPTTKRRGVEGAQDSPLEQPHRRRRIPRSSRALCPPAPLSLFLPAPNHPDQSGSARAAPQKSPPPAPPSAPPTAASRPSPSSSATRRGLPPSIFDRCMSDSHS